MKLEEFKGFYTEEKRNEKIKKEMTRLNRILKQIDKNKKGAIEKLLCDAAFLAIILEEVRLIIARDGVVETYQNGANQMGYKKSSSVDVYDRMVNTYTKVVREICNTIPESKTEELSKEIMEFLKERPK